MILTLQRSPMTKLMNQHLIDYPTPSNLSYFWNFGFLAGLCLAIQLVTGIILAMRYTPHIDLAFISVESIMRDVNGGWILRYAHANGASMFFMIVYIHIGSGLYYGSYVEPSGFVWMLGTMILLLMMATAFMGYCLPWGQMSLWGVTVMTNLFSAFPIVGSKIVTLLWGGFSVDNPTLNRFFSLHYLLPFAIVGAVMVHMAVIHQDGSNNPLGITSTNDKISFFPYFFIKDTLSFIAFVMFLSYWVFYNPNFLGHADNYMPGNPLVTPERIVPEFYFLPSYAILRSIPNKLLGVLALFASILVLLVLPQMNTAKLSSSLYSPFRQFFFWLLVLDFLLLGYIGQQSPESPFIEIGQVASVYYFMYFLAMMPLLGQLENKIVPKSL